MSVGSRGPNRRGRSSSFPFTPELGELIVQDLLRGIPLTKAAARSSVPYATVTHWLARGRQIDGPLEWKRLLRESLGLGRWWRSMSMNSYSI